MLDFKRKLLQHGGRSAESKQHRVSAVELLKATKPPPAKVTPSTPQTPPTSRSAPLNRVSFVGRLSLKSVVKYVVREKTWTKM